MNDYYLQRIFMLEKFACFALTAESDFFSKKNFKAIFQANNLDPFLHLVFANFDVCSEPAWVRRITSRAGRLSHVY